MLLIILRTRLIKCYNEHHMFTYRPQFHGSAYLKHRIGAYVSREFFAYGKRISRVSGEFWLLRMLTPRYLESYADKASAEVQRLHVSGES